MVLEGEGRSWVWRALEGRREEEKVGAEIKVVEPGTRLYQLLTSILFFFFLPRGLQLSETSTMIF